MDLTRQLLLIHLSDIHFGKRHRFNPPAAAGGDTPPEHGYPTLVQSLIADLKSPDITHPVITCCTGDLTETGVIEEFKEAEQFIRALTNEPILGRARGIESIFTIPGNHDVRFDSDDIGIRWQQWAEFYNRIYKTNIQRENPLDFVTLQDRTETHGALILTLNSTVYVQKGKPDQDRGRLANDQLAKVEQMLEAIPKNKLHDSIRIALIHHHPILIPALAEPGRGYDAVHNSGKLLTILRRFGFHLILHGHKHFPNTFTEDVRSAFHKDHMQDALVVAGGSIGSTELPAFPRATNCYNRILIKWHPSARQCRVVVETRGLDMFNSDGTEKLPNRWDWSRLSIADRQFLGGRSLPDAKSFDRRKFSKEDDTKNEKLRAAVYESTRGNMPVVSVMPSLLNGQAYEARFWIVGHGSQRETPKRVIWSAGPKFSVLTVERKDDPNFCARLNYWGPMLVQGRLIFDDGKEALTHIYAHMPVSYND